MEILFLMDVDNNFLQITHIKYIKNRIVIDK